MEILRPDQQVECENGDGVSRRKQLMIRRETSYGDVQWWHFTCAILNDVTTEDYLVRMARSFKGPTR